MTAYYTPQPPGDPSQEYDITVEQFTFTPPRDPQIARYESFVGSALDSDSTYFEDGEPPLPAPLAPVTVTCEHRRGDGMCGSTRLRVRGTWNTPAAVTCENEHAWQGTIEMMRAAINSLHHAS